MCAHVGDGQNHILEFCSITVVDVCLQEVCLMQDGCSLPTLCPGRSVAPYNPGSKEIIQFKSGTHFGPTYFAFVLKYLHLNHVLIRARWYVVEFCKRGLLIQRDLDFTPSSSCRKF